MACKNCDRIRSAILQGKMAEAAGITVEVLREKIGLSPKDEPSDEVTADTKVSAPTKAPAKA